MVKPLHLECVVITQADATGIQVKHEQHEIKPSLARAIGRKPGRTSTNVHSPGLLCMMPPSAKTVVAVT